MTLQTLTTAIAEMAKAQEIINSSSAGTDIYEVNTQTIKDYPMLYITPVGQQMVEENTTKYNLAIYYLDRLLDDSSNEMDILSVAIEQLKNIVLLIQKIAGVVSVEKEYDITVFTATEEFNDRLAGAYCTIVITCVNETICGIE